MTEERRIRVIEVAGRHFEAECIRRPFREGLEVRIELPGGEVLSVAELGLGEAALIEKARALILEWLSRKGTTPGS
jgi:hypothetical protein